MPRVIKQKNNSREPFDEHKLREGLYRSLEKRPVGEEEIETLIEDIKKDIRSSGEREIPSRLIGEVVMQNLIKALQNLMKTMQNTIKALRKRSTQVTNILFQCSTCLTAGARGGPSRTV